MNDDSLHQDLIAAGQAEEVDMLRQAGIDTYSRLLALIQDDAAEPQLRTKLYRALASLYRHVDRRRVAGPLLTAFKSNDPNVRSAAAFALGMMDLKRGIPALSKVATDKSEPFMLRLDALQALGSMRDPRILPILRGIVADTTDNLGLRGIALEQTAWHIDHSSIEWYIALLGDSSPDLRFWAAYCLGQHQNPGDASPALNALDQVVRSDHTLPAYWGWHVDREALYPFELIYYFRASNRDPDCTPANVWIISPAAEFGTFIRSYRCWTESWVYTTDEPPPVTLHVEPAWFTAQLQQQWAGIRLNVRQPTPRAYSVDFQLTLNDQVLMGGLHQDGYTVILTGAQEAMCEFAVWYRSLFAADQALFVYEWAGSAINLTSSLTSQELCTLAEQRI